MVSCYNGSSIFAFAEFLRESNTTQKDSSQAVLSQQKGKSSVKTRLVLSLLVIVLFLVGNAVYETVRGPVESGVAVNQLADSDLQYAASRAIAMGAAKAVMGWSALAALAVIWLSALFGRRKVDAAKTTTTLMVLIVGIVLTTGCFGPKQIEVVEEIGPNETAFLVPLEGASKSGQSQFMSEEYLNENKVATKRVTIPTRKKVLGRGPGNYEWIPTMKLIKVDRTPVTRSWTSSPGTGTSASNEALCVESQESINFCAGATAIASIDEQDAGKFQYYFASKSLADVMDQDVRGQVGIVLAREFGVRTLDKGRKEKSDIFAKALEEAQAFFKPRGVTLLQLGGSEGLQYTDPKIQDAINATFVAENDKNTAENERIAQEKRNQLNVAKAIAEREAAVEFGKAKDANTAIRQLDIEMVQAQAMLEAAKNLKDLKGQLPSVLPPGSSLLFGFDRPIGPQEK